MIALLFVTCAIALAEAITPVSTIFGEVTNINFEVPADLKEAVRFYPKSVANDARYAHVFSTYCPLYPSDDTYFYPSCDHIVRLTFNGFVIDTFRVKGFGIYPQVVNSIMVVTNGDPVAEITRHYAIIRMANSECKIRQYVRDADKDGFETYRRSTTNCDDPETNQFYKEPRLGMKVGDLLEHPHVVVGGAGEAGPERLASVPFPISRSLTGP